MTYKTMLQDVIKAYTNNDLYSDFTVLFVSTTSIIFSVYCGSGETNVYCAKLHANNYTLSCVASDENVIDDL